MINFSKEKLEFKTKEDVLRLHCLIMAFKNGYNLTMSDICCLVELYNTGYNSTFYKNCVNRKFYETEQTVRNSIAKMTNMGILSYKKRGERFIDKNFLPILENDKVIFQYLTGNI